MTVPDWAWPWVGGLAAVGAEFYFRTHPGVPYLLQWPPILLTVVVNYSVFKILSTASSLLAGFILFGTVTMGLRIVLTVWVLHEPVDARTWAALGLLAAAKLLMKA